MELTVNERIRNNIDIMKQVKLNDVIEFARNGAAIKQSEDAKGFPISRIETIWNSTIDEDRLGYADIYDEDLIKYEKYLLKENDILITHINSPKHLGKSAIYTGYPKKLIHGMNLLCLRNNPNFSNSKYLFYYFQTKYFKNQILKISNQSVNQASFAVTNLKELEIPLPSLPTQQKIAEILDTADQLRQYNKQLIEKYDALTQSLFLDMFGDPVRNERGWKKMELGEISDMASGSTPSRTNENNFIGNIPWVKTTEVNGKIINDTLEKISEEALKNSSCRLFPKGSIVIAMYGQGKTRGQIGILGIEAATNQACCVLRPSNKMNFQFLYYTLSMLYDGLRSLGRGGNQPNLNLGLLKNYELINPPLSLQTQFAERVQMIETQKQQAQEALAKSEDLFQGLLQRSFGYAQLP
jgi:type I restriction enzyme S subunit